VVKEIQKSVKSKNPRTSEMYTPTNYNSNYYLQNFQQKSDVYNDSLMFFCLDNLTVPT